MVAIHLDTERFTLFLFSKFPPIAYFALFSLETDPLMIIVWKNIQAANCPQRPHLHEPACLVPG